MELQSPPVRAQIAAARLRPAEIGVSGGSTVDEVVVRARRSQPGDATGSPFPLVEYKPMDIDAFGVASVGELLEAMKVQLKGAGGDPIYLVNGRRVSSFSVLKDLPPEAIAKIQVLPEAEGLRYGYAADQRVINMVLKDPFRVGTGDVAGEGATEGGAFVGKADASATAFTGGKRASFNLSLEQDADLLASERGVLIPPETTTELSGAPGPTNLAPYESLRPWRQTGTLSAVVGRPLGRIQVNVDASLTASRSRAEEGLAVGALTVPASDPYARSGSSESLVGYLPQVGPLMQTAFDYAGHAGLSLDAPIGNWTFSLTAREDHTRSVTRTDLSVNISQAQMLLTGSSAELDPFKPLPASVLNTRLVSRAVSTLDTGTLDVILDGESLRLPAGHLSTTLKVGSDLVREASQTTAPGLDQAETLQREQGRGEVIITVPITSRGRHVLAPLGDLSTNFDLGLTEVSDFGVLTALTAGFDWSPRPTLRLFGSYNLHQDAPTPQNLDAPTIITPNVLAYDSALGKTVLVTQLTGGNPNLKADQVTRAAVSLSYLPSVKIPVEFDIQWQRSDTRNGVSALPTATADIEAAFPDRFVRDASGALTRVDGRSISLDRQTTDDLRLSSTAHKLLTPGVLGKDAVYAFVSITDDWTLDDVVLIRSGFAAINLLEGGAVSMAGGQSAHITNLQAGLEQSGFGIFVSSDYKSRTFVSNGSPGLSLYYSPLVTFDARMFVDVGRRLPFSPSWMQEIRLTMSITNLFDSHQTVRQGTGDIPLAFQRPFLDPLGRLIHFELRKLYR